jgi:uncharacterized membrane protein
VVFVLVSTTPVAYILSAVASQTPTVRCYLTTLNNARQVWGWILLALVVTTALSVLSIVIGDAQG